MQKRALPTYLLYLSYLLFILFNSCSHIHNLFEKKTQREQYEKKISESKQLPQADEWLRAASITLANPLDISLPYSETGYFSADRANAVGLRFSAKRGQKINISLAKKFSENFAVFIDLWKPEIDNPKLLLTADTMNLALEYNADEDTVFIVRIQPELLKQGEYTLTVFAGPSLTFPIPQNIKSSVISFFGSGRDNGERKHEGIDILAPKHSPAIAAANGVVTRVTENALGGKVVFMRPDNANYNLYYAHLDSQIVVEGQHVKTGDVLGLTGNTGNAQFTVSHLHFGIYTNSGAIDPLYFVKAADKGFPKLSVPISILNTWMKTSKNARLCLDNNLNNKNFLILNRNTQVLPEAAAGNLYRVILSDGKKGFITGSSITPVSTSLKKSALKRS